MRILPPSKPKQDRATTHALLIEHGDAPLKLDKAYILVIRGYYWDSMGKPNQNDVNIYDDAIFVISPDTFAAFNANADPSYRGRKLAMLSPQTIDYYKGRHRNKYPALRPYPEGIKLRCTRDGVASMCSHTNIHKGGDVNTHSEGCITIPASKASGYQWDAFIKLVYAQMTKYKQKTIATTIIEYKGKKLVSSTVSTSGQTASPSPVSRLTPETDSHTANNHEEAEPSHASRKEQAIFDDAPSSGSPPSNKIASNPVTVGTAGAAGFGGIFTSFYTAFTQQHPLLIFTSGVIIGMLAVGLGYIILAWYRSRKGKGA